MGCSARLAERPRVAIMHGNDAARESGSPGIASRADKKRNRDQSQGEGRMPMRLHCHCKAALVTLVIAVTLLCGMLAGCASTPAEPVPFKPVPSARIVRPGYTEPAAGLVAADVRRERSRDVIVRFRDALV
jgi:hypothetical protein